MDYEGVDDPGAVSPWVGLDAELMMFRVNRRPMEQRTLFDATAASRRDTEAVEHLWQVLGQVQTIATEAGGRTRKWRLGDVDRQPLEAGDMVWGTFGFERDGVASGAEYDEEARSWTATREERHIADVVPFIFDGETRLLGVVKRPEFRPNRVAWVLTRMLREAEDRLEPPSSIQWTVEPVVNQQAFYDWLRETPVVLSLTMEVRLHNHDIEEEMEELEERLTAKGAKQRTTRYSAQDPSEGLQGLAQDQEVQAHLAEGALGFGSVRGSGRTGAGAKSTFDERRSTARQPVGELVDYGIELYEQLRSGIRGFRQGWREG